MFGNELSDCVKSFTENMGVVFAGFVGRPLYVCTKHIGGGEMCMKVASMSKYIQLGDARTHYRCKKCRQGECADSAPVSDSAPLRVLDLYTLVRDGSKTTFMRSKAYRLCLHAPPPRWGWGKDLGQLPQVTQANPRFVSQASGKFYVYNEIESEAIWCYSCSYEGKPQ